MSDKVCEHTSVQVLVWQEDKLLLIERKRFPFGFAPPAGHCDGDDYETAARRELREEVGLEAENLKFLFEEKRKNPCRRPGGTWHYWKVYEVKLPGPVVIRRSLDEAKQAGWYSKEKIKRLAERTEKYLVGEISEEEWQKSPGLEAIWYQWFIKERKII